MAISSSDEGSMATDANRPTSGGAGTTKHSVLSLHGAGDLEIRHIGTWTLSD